MNQWRPLHPAENHEVLVDGVPSWLMPSVVSMLDALSRQNDSRMTVVIHEFDRLRRSAEPLGPHVDHYYLGQLASRRLDGNQILELIDYLLHIGLLSRGLVAQLFEQAGSKWTATEPGRQGGAAGLTLRVADGVREAVEAAMALPVGGVLLSEAWHAAFGRSADPGAAYSKAIKAVEAAAAPVVSPNNRLATLGTIIRDMRAQRDWRLPTSRPGREQGHEVVVTMAEALWHGQGDRHGGKGFTPSTQEQSEAAVLLAVPLLHFFDRKIAFRGDKWPDGSSGQ